MKRKITITLMLMAALMPFSYVKADPSLIPIELGYIDPEDNQDPQPRAPILVPVLYIDGYTLTAGTGTLGSTIQLLDEDDNVVFSTFLYVEGDIQLPTTLSGTYTIRVTLGTHVFEGEIVL